MKQLSDGRWQVNIRGEIFTYSADDFNEALALAWQIAEDLK
ncbi:hypothetical protein IX317_000602 [Fusobacterium sp. DD29]|nr:MULTISPECIES: hypothetical protein [unclassified Fusobacterium]MBR8700276.1 hypothetical protein [Fusobacterium sp. DD45]MBR8710469.1 hypothetical protein [Fusobacterium sp. DD28]MBR8748941.1 hypothetical protein [Fusobacterium sp. DD29]MBR8751081.1 hypothetical protein [Fusobacterium sp. DD26]MBR8761247.1 hypothetical protein [Fusobacterium sp. DD25]